MSEGLNKKVTILTTTHFKASAHRLHKTYPANHDRRFTHTNLIENTIKHLYKSINCVKLKHIISLDHDDNDVGSNEYLKNLNELSEKYDNLEIIYTTKGIYYSIKNLIEEVDTDYYLWWEHDWKFVKNMDLNKLVDVMDKYENINYIRFNKRKTVRANCDTNLWDVSKYKEINLTGTTGWSNNPYFGRKSKMMEWYDMMDNETSNFHPTIEVILQDKMREDIRKLGLEEAEKKWGVFIYGKINDEKLVEHLNGRDK
tara:strand:- start:425 stop:1192 length:768 start_codon:yes stop_codon:yes gene_type:complete